MFGDCFTSKELLSVFMVLFAVIDIFGSVPIIIQLRQKGSLINPTRTTLVATFILIVFLFLGEQVLALFGVDVNSFAIAGSLVLFAIALEMVLGIEFMKTDTTGHSIIPVAFPLIAGAGSMTTLLSLRSAYCLEVIIIALMINMIIVFLVLKMTDFFERFLGVAGISILKKFFGIILLAIAVKLFMLNIGGFIKKYL